MLSAYYSAGGVSTLADDNLVANDEREPEERKD
jgi:hypothetical protein